jgi:hypothetical protein
MSTKCPHKLEMIESKAFKMIGDPEGLAVPATLKSCHHGIVLIIRSSNRVVTYYFSMITDNV